MLCESYADVDTTHGENHSEVLVPSEMMLASTADIALMNELFLVGRLLVRILYSLAGQV